MSTDRAYSVEVQLPVEAFRHRPWSPAEVASDLRLLWLVDQVRQRQLGYAKAAELAGMPQAAFVRLLGVHHVSPFDLDEAELDREIAAGQALGRP
jgi:predicted HTH domain antitoxin